MKSAYELESLEKRYASLQFLLQFSQYQSFKFISPNAQREGKWLYPRSITRADVKQRWEKRCLEDLDVVFLYGLGLGYDYWGLESWLAENVQRDLVIIEDDLGVLDVFFSHSPLAQTFAQHPQVHIHMLADKPLHDLRLIVKAFPLRHVAVYPAICYEDKRQQFRSLRLQILRSSAVEEAIFTDRLQSHQLFHNVYPNVQKLPSAFYASQMGPIFQGIPAIICGAGPSLKNSAPFLSSFANKSVIFAGGSAISALGFYNVEPDFCN